VDRKSFQNLITSLASATLSEITTKGGPWTRRNLALHKAAIIEQTAIKSIGLERADVLFLFLLLCIFYMLAGVCIHFCDADKVRPDSAQLLLIALEIPVLLLPAIFAISFYTLHCLHLFGL
jgi:hypothetical protein